MIDIDAVNEATRNGEVIPFEELIVFDSDRREDCAMVAWKLYVRSSYAADRYSYGRTVEEWKHTYQILSDANPHYNREAKFDAMVLIERASC